MRRYATALAMAAILVVAPLGTAGAADEALTMKGAIKGAMRIDFRTRAELDYSGSLTEGSSKLGVTDVYNVDLWVADSVNIAGTVERWPWMPYARSGLTAQEGSIRYDLGLALRNPKNPAQVRQLGKWAGALTIDREGRYHLARPPQGSGPMRIMVDAVGNIPGFSGNFAGEIQGRKPKQAGLVGLVDSTRAQVAKRYQRATDKGLVTIEVANADPMQFLGVAVPQGPLASYPETRIDGSFDYDPEASVWYLDLVTAYSVGGRQARDRLSGTIRWLEDPNRQQNGRGWYELNVRLNEGSASVAQEAAMFEDAGSAEEAFFAEDVSVPGFIGRINYVDRFDAERVVASDIGYAVDANQATKVQQMNFAKLLLLVIGPFNDE